MIQGYQVFDADAHAMFTPKMWEGLPEEYVARRPRPVRVSDADDMGRWSTGWLIEGRMEPHLLGPGAQAANTPWHVLEEFGASPNNRLDIMRFPVPVGSLDITDQEARLHDMDHLGIDTQMLFPTTLYSNISSDPGYEAAMYRAHNRYMGRQCKFNPKRMKWAGLIPLRDQGQALEALAEMQELGASAAVVFGTAGERLLSHASLAPIWDEFSRTGLPLCVHMGMSYPPFAELCHDFFDSNMISKALPAQLAFVAIVGHNMLEKYPNLKVAFLEFGAEWIFYMLGRMEHYVGVNKQRMTLGGLPRRDVEDYVKSGRIFVAAEADDPMLVHEMGLLGEDQMLFSSDFPHGEGRESALEQVLKRKDITDEQKRKIFYDNTVRLYGEP